MRLDGISFICRVHNEERTLARSLMSLQGVSIPHEIIVILHRCTDRSSEIARDFPNVRIFEFDLPISRAGYETLVTPADSAHSIVSYCQWCFSLGARHWFFKWDADFIAPPELVDWLNSRSWGEAPPTRIRMNAVTPEASENYEPYLFNGDPHYAKYIFWEYNKALFVPGVLEVREDLEIIHDSPLTDSGLKAYWKSEPWFFSTKPQFEELAQELRVKYQRLVALLGPEPKGMARGANVQSHDMQRAVQANEAALASFNVYLRS
jgi:hypothetical protein